ncbi:unnamed protein product, partial [Coccothraustes coccothraustes]
GITKGREGGQSQRKAQLQFVQAPKKKREESPRSRQDWECLLWDSLKTIPKSHQRGWEGWKSH